MDRGQVEIEEARQTRERRASVFKTDKEKDEYEVMRTVLRNWCNSCVRGRAKQSHRCPTSDTSRSMAKDCRVSIRNVNENLPMVLVLFERIHGVERDCQVSHEATEPHAVDYVRVHLDACGLSEVLFKRDIESAARVPVVEREVERSEEAAVRETPKCSHQSSGEAEDTVRRIESPTRIGDRVLREKFGRKVDSASSRPDRQVALSQTEKRSDEHSTRSRVKSKECDGPLAQVGETVGFKVACCAMAELELRWVTRVRLDRTGEKSESVVGTAAGVELSQPIREPVKNDEWQRVDDGKQKKACHRFPHPRRDATRPSAFDGFTASNNEVSKEARTVDESKRDWWRPNSSKSCEGLTIGWRWGIRGTICNAS